MVTGACGFIGSQLVHTLLSNGVRKVFAVDSLLFGTSERIEGLGDRVEFIQHTLGTDPISNLAERASQTDCLFHLAAEKHNQALDSPMRIADTNIVGTSQLFELAATSHIKRIVFSSSLYAHGGYHAPALKETDTPNPQTLYGFSKLSGERLLQDTLRRHPDMSGLSLRYFFVYGPGQHNGKGYKSVIPKNFERLAKHEAPLIHGTGEQSLDFTHVSDIADATVAAARSPITGDVIHIGSGKGLSINHLTHVMTEVSGLKLKAVHAAADWTEGTARVADTEKRTRLLDWAPKISLVDGLQDVWKEFKTA